MEVNLPDKGLFRGIGKLETNLHINKKHYPRLRNIHRFDFTHHRHNHYQTSFQTYKPFESKFYHYEKVKKNRNQSQVNMGNDRTAPFLSESKKHYIKHDKSLPPKPFKQVPEGIGINQYEERTGEKITYCPTTKDSFNPNKKMAQNINYKYLRTEHYNPITGQSKLNISFGYQDYVPKNNKAYRANNHTIVPRTGERFDIISGRKLTYG